MAVPPASPANGRRKNQERENNKEMAPPPAKRSKNPGVRVLGGRIYDSENGKTCHQCRQKTMDFSTSCKAMKKDKTCTIRFCHKCLLNRYGEKAEEVSTLDDWKCPKCRGDCNCSFCMKRKGKQPTGLLAPTAKLAGFSSVHDLLKRGSENALRDATASPKKPLTPKKELVPSKKRRDKENQNCEQNVNVNERVDCVKRKKLPVNNKDEKPAKRLKQASLKSECGINNSDQTKKKNQTKNTENSLPSQEDSKENIHDITKVEAMAKSSKLKGRPRKIGTMPVRPPGKSLTMVAGVDLPIEDVGHALQFLEFCNVFSKVLDIKKGEPEAIIRELVRGIVSHRRCRATSAIIQFQIRLLSIILEDMGEESCLETRGENSWLKALDKCLKEYKHLATWLPFDLSDVSSGYNNLDSSKKLRVLVFLCDEALATKALRNFLEEENTKFAQVKKERKEQILAVKTKEKLAIQTLKNDLAKAMLPTEGDAQLSISEHDELVSKIRQETEKARQEVQDLIGGLPKQKHTSEAVRTCPLFLEKDGVVFWRLNSHNKSSSIILQDFEKCSAITPQDKWFIFDDEQQQMVEKYISSLSSDRAKEQRDLQKNALQDGIKNNALQDGIKKNVLQDGFKIKDEPLDISEPQNCLEEVKCVL